MRRSLSLFGALLAILATGLLATSSYTGTFTGPSTNAEFESEKLAATEPHDIKIIPWGPGPDQVESIKAALPGNPLVQKYLKGTRYRLIAFEYIDMGKDATGTLPPPERFRAIFFDYTNNRTITATGAFRNPSQVTVAQTKDRPNPSEEEFNDAVAVISKDPTLGPKLADGSLTPYPPMPPLAEDEFGKGGSERTVTVGLVAKDSTVQGQIVGVNMVRQTVVRYANNAPVRSAVDDHSCGIPNAGQSSSGRGSAGQFEFIISRGDLEIWRFVVIRPSSSSASDASGIELRNVSFRGKRVLAQAHVPILNVQYERNACGPFRDWQWQESFFQADGTDVTTGIRMCTSFPTTCIDTGNDAGNFRGVAVYDKDEVYLVSELTAGWYRYISMWVFNDNGVIKPRYGFGATVNSCVCLAHVHHVYWRFDFDINGGGEIPVGNTIIENGVGQPVTQTVERTGIRTGDPRQFWSVINPVTKAAVSVIPGPRDGNTDKYGKYDLVFLRYNPNELDDQSVATGSAVNLGPFVNGQLIANQDIVFWYAGHWGHTHNDTNQFHGQGQAVIGPDIVITNW